MSTSTELAIAPAICPVFCIAVGATVVVSGAFRSVAVFSMNALGKSLGRLAPGIFVTGIFVALLIEPFPLIEMLWLKLVAQLVVTAVPVTELPAIEFPARELPCKEFTDVPMTEAGLVVVAAIDGVEAVMWSCVESAKLIMKIPSCVQLHN